MTQTAKRRVVVLGCGFGGYSLLARLSPRRFDATLVSPRNYFLFTPLLASAVSGTVEGRSIVEPARKRLRGVRVLEGEAVRVDWERGSVLCTAPEGPEFELPCDDLVIAVGTRPADFGVPGVSEHALPVSDVADAKAIRRAVLSRFGRAELPTTDEPAARRLLRTVVCGGGPTGVEVAAEIRDLLARELARAYPGVAGLATVVLLEAGPAILGGFDGALRGYATRQFRREGVEVRTGTAVAAIDEGGVELEDGERIDCGLVIWAAGRRPVPFVDRLEVEKDGRGRLLVGPDLGLPGRPGVFALGDCAALGEPALPATAQVAQRQGVYLARSFERRRRGKAVGPFRHRDLGMLAYIGAGKALADLPGVKWSGRLAWLFWRSVYLTKLVSPANKAKVLFDWAKARVFGRDLSGF